MSKITTLIENLSLFDPEINSQKILPQKAGFYIICFKKDSTTPSELKNATFEIYQNLKVLYVGITNAKRGIRRRNYKNHFNGNAGGSTLRKSLGVLFEYKLIARDKHVSNNKKKFSKEDEFELSNWMKKNLCFFYKVLQYPDSIEQDLINLLKPPLNLDKTKQIIENQEIRQKIRFLRNKNSHLIAK